MSFRELPPETLTQRLGDFIVDMPANAGIVDYHNAKTVDEKLYSFPKREVPTEDWEKQKCPETIGITFQYIYLGSDDPNADITKLNNYTSTMYFAWNPISLYHIDENAKKAFEAYEQQVARFSLYQDTKFLRKKTLSINYKNFTEPYLVRKTSCAISFSYPIYLEKVPNSLYDFVYYVEAIEGNGEYDMPNQHLILKKNDSWIEIIKDNVSSDEFYWKSKEIKFESLSQDTNADLQAVVETWDRYYRNEKEIESWIQETLKSVTWKPL
jgi:hypothetical protein